LGINDILTWTVDSWVRVVVVLFVSVRRTTLQGALPKDQWRHTTWSSRIVGLKQLLFGPVRASMWSSSQGGSSYISVGRAALDETCDMATSRTRSFIVNITGFRMTVEFGAEREIKVEVSSEDDC
jgi:hypothetical protein